MGCTYVRCRTASFMHRGLPQIERIFSMIRGIEGVANVFSTVFHSSPDESLQQYAQGHSGFDYIFSVASC